MSLSQALLPLRRFWLSRFMPKVSIHHVPLSAALPLFAWWTSESATYQNSISKLYYIS